MNPSRLFIERPVATSLLMLAILLAGLLAYRLLPLSALPEVDYPTIQVTTLYPGASPDVIVHHGDRAAGTPVRPDAGAEPDDQSTSSGGASVITLALFARTCRSMLPSRKCRRPSTAAGNLLPSDLPMPPVYSKVNPADAPVLTIAVTSPSLPVIKVHDLAENRLAPKLSQVDGVGLVSHRRRAPALPCASRPTRPGAGRAGVVAGRHALARSRPPTSTRPRAASTVRSAHPPSTPTTS